MVVREYTSYYINECVDRSDGQCQALGGCAFGCFVGLTSLSHIPFKLFEGCWPGINNPFGGDCSWKELQIHGATRFRETKAGHLVLRRQAGSRSDTNRYKTRIVGHFIVYAADGGS